MKLDSGERCANTGAIEPGYAVYVCPECLARIEWYLHLAHEKARVQSPSGRN